MDTIVGCALLLMPMQILVFAIANTLVIGGLGIIYQFISAILPRANGNLKKNWADTPKEAIQPTRLVVQKTMEGKMIIICNWCGKKCGEKEPLEDKSEISGICKECADEL